MNQVVNPECDTRVIYPGVLRGDRMEPKIITHKPKLTLSGCRKCGSFRYLVNAQLVCCQTQTSCPDCGWTTTGCAVWVGSRAGQPVERSIFSVEIPEALKRNIREREEQKQKEG